MRGEGAERKGEDQQKRERRGRKGIDDALHLYFSKQRERPRQNKGKEKKKKEREIKKKRLDLLGFQMSCFSFIISPFHLNLPFCI